MSKARRAVAGFGGSSKSWVRAGFGVDLEDSELIFGLNKTNGRVWGSSERKRERERETMEYLKGLNNNTSSVKKTISFFIIIIIIII